MNYKRRFGDRKVGRRLRSLDPLMSMTPYIMKNRVGAQNLIRDYVGIEEMEKFIREMREKGYKGFGTVHIFIAAYIRTVSLLPGINRFVAGQRIYARNGIEVMMAIKKELKLNAMETVMKIHFEPTDTVFDVYEKFNAELEKNRAAGDRTDFDKTARFLNYIPGLILKFTIFLINILDYFDLLPTFLLNVSPFHGSFFITSMGSLGIPPIYHHLYDFGNVPIFCSYGTKRTVTVTNSSGEREEKRFIDYTFVTDERICDGHYYAQALKTMREYLANPRPLCNAPETVTEDIY